MEEIIETMDDLRAHNVDIMTIGQYLQPTKKHAKVVKILFATMNLVNYVKSQ